MKKGFKDITWGLILATFHIKLGTLEIVPSFIGWILVAEGVKILVNVKAEGQVFMTKAKRWSVALSIISLLGLIVTVFDNGIGDSHLSTIIFSLCEVLFIYYFLSGVTEIFTAKGNIEYAKENARMLSGYTIFYVIGLLIMCINWFTYSLSIGAFLTIYMIVLRIYIIYRVYKMGKML